MSVPRGLVLTVQVRRNLSDLLLASEQRWGRQQRIAYRARLAGALRDLVQFPHLGRSRDDIAPGVRALPVGQHVDFYRADDASVTIIRILHQRMDAAAESQEPS